MSVRQHKPKHKSPLLKIRILSQLSLFVIIFSAITGFIPANKSILCLLPAWARESEFGTDGSSGSDGVSGRNGRNGEDKSIFADGTSYSLDLSGGDGGDGASGSRGNNGDCDSQH